MKPILFCVFVIIQLVSYSQIDSVQSIRGAGSSSPDTVMIPIGYLKLEEVPQSIVTEFRRHYPNDSISSAYILEDQITLKHSNSNGDWFETILYIPDYFNRTIKQMLFKDLPLVTQRFLNDNHSEIIPKIKEIKWVYMPDSIEYFEVEYLTEDITQKSGIEYLYHSLLFNSKGENLSEPPNESEILNK